MVMPRPGRHDRGVVGRGRTPVGTRVGRRRAPGPRALTGGSLTRHGCIMAELPGSGVLGRLECLRLLAQTSVGRIVYTSGSLPAVRPVTYVLDGESIVIRTTEESTLARSQVVAFEIDSIDRDAEAGWSVIVTGRARPVTDPAQQRRLAELSVQTWGPAAADTYVRIGCEVVTGRRVGVLRPQATQQIRHAALRRWLEGDRRLHSRRGPWERRRPGHPSG